MIFPFNATARLILVEAQLDGPLGVGILTLALDTGATHTLLKPRVLTSVGYSLSSLAPTANVNTANGIVALSRIVVSRISALGQVRSNHSVIVQALPPTASFDGLLGLDFIRGLTLTIDYRTAQITLV